VTRSETSGNQCIQPGLEFIVSYSEFKYKYRYDMHIEYIHADSAGHFKEKAHNIFSWIAIKISALHICGRLWFYTKISQVGPKSIQTFLTTSVKTLTNLPYSSGSR
jgi:hypothetical protein